MLLTGDYTHRALRGQLVAFVPPVWPQEAFLWEWLEHCKLAAELYCLRAQEG